MSNVLWQDFEEGNYGIIRGGLTGQSGYMPQELHLQKLEQTCMFEREDQLDDHYRSILKDRTPDAPTMAQDLPRESQNQLRKEVMSVRFNGARSAAEPIHPDLFLGFTERDTRGHHNSGPDFRKVAQQSKSRGRFKDFVSDHASDWTITGGNRSEMRAIMDLRKTIGASKERMKIFSTGFDSRLVPQRGIKTNQTNVLKTTLDGTILNLNDAQEQFQRKDNTSLKSDLVKIGYRRTTDHRFAVAQYGIVSSKQKTANIGSTRYANEISHKYDIHPSEVKNRLLLNIMKEVGRRDYLNKHREEMAGDFQNSEATKNTIKKLMSDLSTVQANTKMSADVVDLGYVNANINKVRVYDPVSKNTVIVDKNIFDIAQEAKNITFVKKSDMTRRNGIAQVNGNSSEVYVYSRKQPGAHTILPVKMEQKWYESDYTALYKRNPNLAKVMDHTYVEQGQGVNPNADAVFDRHAKGAGYHQIIRQDIDTQETFDPVNDVQADVRKVTRKRPKRMMM